MLSKSKHGIIKENFIRKEAIVLKDLSTVVRILAENIRNLETLGVIDENCKVISYKEITSVTETGVITNADKGVFKYPTLITIIRQEHRFENNTMDIIYRVLEDAFKGTLFTVRMEHVDEKQEGYMPILYGIKIKLIDQNKQ